jgi:hypothetical protein
MQAKGFKAKAEIVRSVIQCYVIGFPTPYGFRLRGQAYARMTQLTTDLNTIRAKYDAALSINNTTHSKLVETSTSLKQVHEDARILTKVVKELVNHPHVVSPETQSIVDQYRMN